VVVVVVAVVVVVVVAAARVTARIDLPFQNEEVVNHHPHPVQKVNRPRHRRAVTMVLHLKFQHEKLLPVVWC
jgi:hypothetical protein